MQSRVFSVGNGVLWAEAEVGAVATQAIVDVSYGPKSLALLREGLRPAEVIKKIWEADPDPRPQDWSKQGRQFAVMICGKVPNDVVPKHLFPRYKRATKMRELPRQNLMRPVQSRS